MEDALESGAEDFAADGDIFEITTEPSDLETVRDELGICDRLLRKG